MLDSKSYDKIWSKKILPLLRFYCEKYNYIQLSKTEKEIKDDIWENYAELNNRCRNYMKSDIERLDRHKVSSCYILAIIKSNPLCEKGNDTDTDTVFVASEQLAISVGLKILQEFLLSKYDRNNNLKSTEKYEKDKAIFDNGFVFPGHDEVEHGDYRNNFAIELYFTAKEQDYNILSLSHSLYLLEIYNRIRYDK